ncbi:MAG: 30S ribosomal protein S5 [Patescibacteria group bacterium]
MGQNEGKKGKRGFAKPESEFEQKILDLARVTRVMAGGKRMRFRACVAIGDKKGRFGVGLAKGADVTFAVNKAVNKAKKNLRVIPIVNETIPMPVHLKYKSAQILLKPAPRGTGIKAGGAMRVLLELAGVPNVVGKSLGTGNKITVVGAFYKAVDFISAPFTKQRKFVTRTEKKILPKIETLVAKEEVVEKEVKEEKPKVKKIAVKKEKKADNQ